MESALAREARIGRDGPISAKRRFTSRARPDRARAPSGTAARARRAVGAAAPVARRCEATVSGSAEAPADLGHRPQQKKKVAGDRPLAGQNADRDQDCESDGQKKQGLVLHQGTHGRRSPSARMRCWSRRCGVDDFDVTACPRSEECDNCTVRHPASSVRQNTSCFNDLTRCPSARPARSAPWPDLARTHAHPPAPDRSRNTSHHLAASPGCRSTIGQE